MVEDNEKLPEVLDESTHTPWKSAPCVSRLQCIIHTGLPWTGNVCRERSVMIICIPNDLPNRHCVLCLQLAINCSLLLRRQATIGGSR